MNEEKRIDFKKWSIIILIFLIIGLTFWIIELRIYSGKLEAERDYYRENFINSCNLNNKLISNVNILLTVIPENSSAHGDSIETIDCESLLIKYTTRGD